MANTLSPFDIEVAKRVATWKKEVLTTAEAAEYMGIAKSYLYKLTMNRAIPHYKSPTGRLCYFNRVELEQWLQQSKVRTNEELDNEVMKGGLK